MIYEYKEGWKIEKGVGFGFNVHEPSKDPFKRGFPYWFHTERAAKMFISKKINQKTKRKVKKKKTPKVVLPPRIRITHGCFDLTDTSKVHTKMMQSKKGDSISYYRSYNWKSTPIKHVILEHPDKSEDWWEKLPEVWNCPTCPFEVKKETIMNTYFFRKMSKQ